MLLLLLILCIFIILEQWNLASKNYNLSNFWISFIFFISKMKSKAFPMKTNTFYQNCNSNIFCFLTAIYCTKMLILTKNNMKMHEIKIKNFMNLFYNLLWYCSDHFFDCEFFIVLYLIQMNKKGNDLVGRTVKGYKIIKSIG